jgi:serine/threonine protein kinase
MELFDMNLYEAIKDRKNYLKEPLIQWYTYQLLKALEITHKKGIFHRDLKPENILLKDHHLVLADLGSCKGIKARMPFTEYVSTRWYRAPECIMTNGYYNYKMDMWGVGCVLFEMASLFPLFPGDNEIDQMIKIQGILGPPSEEVINLYKQNSLDKENQTSLNMNIKGKGFEKHLSHCNDLFIDLLKKLLVYHPEERLSAKQALQHAFFKDITENQYYNQYFVSNQQSNLLAKNIGNDSLSMIKIVDDSPPNNLGKTKNYNNMEKKGSNNKLSNINIMNMGNSSNNLMININNNSLNKNNFNSNNSNSNMEQHSQRNLRESLENETNNNSFKKDNNYKIKLPKILKIKLSNLNTNNNNVNVNVNVNTNNNIVSNYKPNLAIIGGMNYDLAKNLNNSIDYNSNISYIKGVSMTKKMNILKSKYVSPYSRKAIFNLPQKHGKQ